MYLYIVCLNQSVVSLKEVHSSSKYHGSLEQNYAKIAKSYAGFTIRHDGSSTTVAFEDCEEESPTKDDTYQSTRHNMHTVVSFPAETYFLGKKE